MNPKEDVEVLKARVSLLTKEVILLKRIVERESKVGQLLVDSLGGWKSEYTHIREANDVMRKIHEDLEQLKKQ